MRSTLLNIKTGLGGISACFDIMSNEGGGSLSNHLRVALKPTEDHEWEQQCGCDYHTGEYGHKDCPPLVPDSCVCCM